MSNSKLLGAIFSAAAQLQKQFPILNAAPENGRFVAELDTFFSLANAFDESLGWLWQERFKSELTFDYCPAVAEPSLNEVEQRYRALIEHIETLSGFTHFGLKAWLRNACRLSADLVGAVDWLVSAVAGDLDAASSDHDAVPDFGHRLSPVVDIGSSLSLTDTVSMMVNKADAVLTILGNHFAKDDEDRPSDDAIFYALQSIKDELSDIGAVVEAFHRNAAGVAKVEP